MDQEKVGSFMQTLRKEKGMTQKELAEKLCVSDKTISKWENGNSLPDTSFLPDLCKELDISVNELLSCERLSPDEYSKKSEVTIMELMKENQENRKGTKVQLTLGIIFLILTLLMFGLSVGFNITWLIDFPTIIIITFAALAAVLLSGKRKMKEIVSFLRKVIIPIGVLVALVSGISMLRSLDTPQTIGPKLAAAFISLMYSVVIYLLLSILDRTE